MQVPTCAVHGNPMTQRTGQYGLFWSCGQKNPDGTWCKYRPPLPPQGNTTGGQPIPATYNYQPPRPAPSRPQKSPEERASIERQTAINAASSIAASGKIQASEVLNYAKQFVNFIQGREAEPEIQLDMEDSGPVNEMEYPV